MSKTYGYKGKQAINDALWVSVKLRPYKNEIFLGASKLSRAGNGEIYPTSSRNKKKHLSIPSDASEQLLGEAALEMLAECTHGGKTSEQVQKIVRLSGGR